MKINRGTIKQTWTREAQEQPIQKLEKASLEKSADLILKSITNRPKTCQIQPEAVLRATMALKVRPLLGKCLDVA
jgi:hypothetical protein